MVRIASSAYQALNNSSRKGSGSAATFPSINLSFQSAGLLGQFGDQVYLAAGQRGDDRGRQFERGMRAQMTVLDPAQHQRGIEFGDGGVDDLVERPVHREQVVRSEELVDF